jgi:hypothetical protein
VLTSAAVRCRKNDGEETNEEGREKGRGGKEEGRGQKVESRRKGKEGVRRREEIEGGEERNRMNKENREVVNETLLSPLPWLGTPGAQSASPQPSLGMFQCLCGSVGTEQQTAAATGKPER